MKKMLTFLLSLMLLLSLCPAALADIAYEPSDNFYEKHMDECSYENRWYYTNGGEGYVVGFSFPTGSAQEAFPNGTRFLVSWTYGEGGDTWGCIEYDSETLTHGYDDKSCWVKMSDMQVDYDSESFTAEHAADIVEETNEIKLPDYKTYMVCWKYPGSDTVRYTIGGHADTISFQKAYTDPAGRKWGYCGYWQGHRQFWVCLDEPFNENLEPDENFVDVLAQLTPAADEAAMAAALKEVKAPNYTLIFGAIGVAAIAAALLVYVLLKKKKA